MGHPQLHQTDIRGSFTWLAIAELSNDILAVLPHGVKRRKEKLGHIGLRLRALWYSLPWSF